MDIKKPKNIKELMAFLMEARAEGAEVQMVAEPGAEVPPELAEMMKAMGVGGIDCPVLEAAELAKALMEKVAIFAKPTTYAPGTFVRYREDICYVRDHRSLHCVLEILPAIRQVPLTDENDGNCTVYRRYDCILAKGSSKGGIVCHLADSRELEIYPDVIIPKSS